jgi:hypothetical protein
MMVPPRNPKKDRLVTLPMMFYSYFQAGAIQTGICYFVHYMVTNPSSTQCDLINLSLMLFFRF